MKRFLSVCLLLCMMLSLVFMSSVSVNAASSGTVGSCKWTLEGTVLTISGNGKLYTNFESGPWGKSITEVKINEGITSVGGGVFAECTSLNKVTLPSTLLEIQYGAFQGCTALTAVTLPDGITTIDSNAFSCCFSLIDIRIPKSVNYIGIDAFSECYALNNILVDAENPSFTSIDGVLFSKDKTIIVRYPPNKKGISYTVPSGVKEVGKSCFESARNLFTVDLPDSITKIGANAFFSTSMYYDSSKFINGCLYIGNNLIVSRNENMTKCTVRAGTKTIADGAFILSPKIEEVILPEGLTHIGDSAFSWCDKLKSISIPKSLKEISNSAFYECKSLDKVYYSGSKNDRAKISIGMQNELFTSASWKYDTCYGGVDHKWESAIITKEADCTNAGEKQKTCSVCSVVSKEKIDSLGHKHELWSQSKAPTCVETGKEESNCTTCGYLATKTLPALGHVFGPWKVDIEPSCEDVGVQKRVCSICQGFEAQNIDSKGHSFGEWITDAEPTCTSDGEQKRTCSSCNSVETNVLAALGHLYSAGETVKQPTKKETGLEVATCAACGNVLEKVLPMIESNGVGNGCAALIGTTAKAMIITLVVFVCGVMVKKRKIYR